MADIFSSQEQLKKLSEEEKKDRAREISDVRKVLKLPEGRRMIWWILAKTHIFQSSFALNTKVEDFQEGERNIGLQLLNRVNEADVTAFTQMQNEYISELKSKQAVKEAQKEEEE